eukprot:5179405-Amphidinium_carterae.1
MKFPCRPCAASYLPTMSLHGSIALFATVIATLAQLESLWHSARSWSELDCPAVDDNLKFVTDLANYTTLVDDHTHYVAHVEPMRGMPKQLSSWMDLVCLIADDYLEYDGDLANYNDLADNSTHYVAHVEPMRGMPKQLWPVTLLGTMSCSSKTLPTAEYRDACSARAFNRARVADDFITCGGHFTSATGNELLGHNCLRTEPQAHLDHAPIHLAKVGLLDVYSVHITGDARLDADAANALCLAMNGVTPSDCFEVSSTNHSIEQWQFASWYTVCNDLVGTSSQPVAGGLGGGKPVNHPREEAYCNPPGEESDTAFASVAANYWQGLVALLNMWTLGVRFRKLKTRMIRRPDMLYNPRMPNDCFFECVARQALKRGPTRSELRRPGTSQCSLRSTSLARQSLWGGQPDARLLETVFAAKLTIVHGNSPVPRDPLTCYLRLEREHFTVCGFSKQKQWTSIAILIRKRDRQLANALDRFDLNANTPAEGEGCASPPDDTASNEAKKPSGRGGYHTATMMRTRSMVEDVGRAADLPEAAFEHTHMEALFEVPPLLLGDWEPHYMSMLLTFGAALSEIAAKNIRPAVIGGNVSFWDLGECRPLGGWSFQLMDARPTARVAFYDLLVR